MSSYMVYFDFTTIHRGSRFVGRSGQVDVTCKEEIDINKDADDLQNVVASFIHSKYPKWNILMINIKSINQLS